MPTTALDDDSEGRLYVCVRILSLLTWKATADIQAETEYSKDTTILRMKETTAGSTGMGGMYVWMYVWMYVCVRGKYVRGTERWWTISMMVMMDV